MLKHAVSNLIQNAIKYNTENGKVHIKTKKANNQLLIIVSDTGIGISPDAQAHIFEPFYRENKQMTKKVGGAGLGLAIVKSIIEQHNGTIQYHPNEPSSSALHMPYM